MVGDPLTLTVTVSGDGNLEALSPPAIPDDSTWQSFTPTSGLPFYADLMPSIGDTADVVLQIAAAGEVIY